MINNLFIGSFFHSIDEKNRIQIPANYKPEKDDELYALLEVDGVISLYTDIAMIDEVLYPALDSVKVDNNHRINLGKQLLAFTEKYGQIKNVGILGKNDHFDIIIDKELDKHIKEIGLEKITNDNTKFVLAKKR